MSAGINISNYEAFLLRFIDGDLGSAELAEWQDFLEQHPHIQQELLVWESTVLTPDPQVVFEYKELLYRGQPEIHVNNQASFLLSYMDNELSATDREAVEKYVAATPAAKAELALLQMTRLQPDMDQVFVPKSSLYRHRRVLPVYWWSAGAAALVAGLLVIGWPSAHTGHGSVSQPVAIVHAPVVAPGQNTPASPEAQHMDALPETAATTENVHPANAVATRTPASRDNAGTPATRSLAATNVQGANTSTARTASHGAANVNNPSATPVADNNLIAAAANPAPASSTTTTTSHTTANNVTAGSEPATIASSTERTMADQDQPADKPPVMLAVATATEHAAAPSAIHGELIASVVGTGDSKLLDKVTNVARFFAKKKANNK